MNEGRKFSIKFIGTCFDIVVQPRLYGGELLDIVSSHFNLKSKEYFGICFIEEHHNQSRWHWLQMDKYVLDHEFLADKKFEPALTLHFKIKFYPESINYLNDARVIELLFLQSKLLFFEGKIIFDDPDYYVEAAALVLQITAGNFVSNQTSIGTLKSLTVGQGDLDRFTTSVVPPFDSNYEQIVSYHERCEGMSRGQAVMDFLQIMEKSMTYGVHYYEVKDKQNVPHWLGISFRGIVQYSYDNRLDNEATYRWKNLENLYFRDKKFSIEVHEDRRNVLHALENNNSRTNSVTTTLNGRMFPSFATNVGVHHWYAPTPQMAKSLWALSVSQHQFSMDQKNNKTLIDDTASKDIIDQLTHNKFEYDRSTTTTPQKSPKYETTRKLRLTELIDLQETRLKLIEKKFALLQELEEKKGLLSQLCDQESKFTEEAQISLANTTAKIMAGYQKPPSLVHNFSASTLGRRIARKQPAVLAANSLISDNNVLLKNPSECIADRLHLDTTFKISENMFFAANRSEGETTVCRREDERRNLLGKESHPVDGLGGMCGDLSLSQDATAAAIRSSMGTLRLDYEVQSKITNAAYCLASDATISRGVRKMRKAAYQKSFQKLKDMGERIDALQPEADTERQNLNNHSQPPHTHAIYNSRSFENVNGKGMENHVSEPLPNTRQLSKFTNGIKRLKKPAAFRLFSSKPTSRNSTNPNHILLPAKSLNDISSYKPRADPAGVVDSSRHSQQIMHFDDNDDTNVTPTRLTFANPFKSTTHIIDSNRTVAHNVCSQEQERKLSGTNNFRSPQSPKSQTYPSPLLSYEQIITAGGAANPFSNDDGGEVSRSTTNSHEERYPPPSVKQFDSLSVNANTTVSFDAILCAQVPQKSYSTSALRATDLRSTAKLPPDSMMNASIRDSVGSSSLESYVSSLGDLAFDNMRNEMVSPPDIDVTGPIYEKTALKGYSQGDFYNTKCSYRSRNYPTLAKATTNSLHTRFFQSQPKLPLSYNGGNVALATLTDENIHLTRPVQAFCGEEFTPLGAICQDFDEYCKPYQPSDYLRYSKSPYKHLNAADRELTTTPNNNAHRLKISDDGPDFNPPTAYLCSTKPSDRYYLSFQEGRPGMQTLVDLLAKKGSVCENVKKSFLQQAASKDSGIGGSLIDVPYNDDIINIKITNQIMKHPSLP